MKRRTCRWRPSFRSYAGMTRIRFKGPLNAISAPSGAPLGMRYLCGLWQSDVNRTRAKACKT